MYTNLYTHIYICVVMSMTRSPYMFDTHIVVSPRMTASVLYVSIYICVCATVCFIFCFEFYVQIYIYICIYIYIRISESISIFIFSATALHPNTFDNECVLITCSMFFFGGEGRLDFVYSKLLFYSNEAPFVWWVRFVFICLMFF